MMTQPDDPAEADLRLDTLALVGACYHDDYEAIDAILDAADVRELAVSAAILAGAYIEHCHGDVDAELDRLRAGTVNEDSEGDNR